MSKITENKDEGWAQGSSMKGKWHYYRNTRSLCGRVTLLFRTAPYEQGNDDSSDNCPKCREKLLKERAKEAANQ